MGEEYITQRAWFVPLQAVAALRVSTEDDKKLLFVPGKRQRTKQTVILKLMAAGLNEDDAHGLVWSAGYRNAYELFCRVRDAVQVLTARGLSGEDAAQMLEWICVGLCARGYSDYRREACSHLVGPLPSPGSYEWRGFFVLVQLLRRGNAKLLQRWSRKDASQSELRNYEVPAPSGSTYPELTRWILRANVWRNNQWAQLPAESLHYLVEANICLLRGVLIERRLNEFLPGSVEELRKTLERILQAVGVGFSPYVSSTVYWEIIEMAIKLAREDWRQVVP